MEEFDTTDRASPEPQATKRVVYSSSLANRQGPLRILGGLNDQAIPPSEVIPAHSPSIVHQPRKSDVLSPASSIFQMQGIPQSFYIPPGDTDVTLAAFIVSSPHISRENVAKLTL
jgi:hypothetical protein